MDEEKRKELEWARSELATLRERMRCCMLGTVSAGGNPLCSYAPVFIDDSFRFYVYVSAMAKHYGHLRKQRKASVALIEDESAAENLFARKRLAVDCAASLVERGCDEWRVATDGIAARCGETMNYLKELADFDLFRLEPTEGRLVLGFGKAYRIFGHELGDLDYVGAGGHRAKS